MMDWQTPTVGLLVMAATVYLARQAWRMLVGKKPGCGSGCGKCGADEHEAPNRISLPRAD